MDIKEFLNVKKVYLRDESKPIHHVILDQLTDSLNKRRVGYCLEFGVWRGRTINHMARSCPDQKFYGFDSFEGLPKKWSFGKREMPKGFFSLSNPPPVENNVELVVGQFEESISRWKEDHTDLIGFMHIDSDLYESSKTIFDELNYQIAVGTIIVLDELCDFRLLIHPETKRHLELPRKTFNNWKYHEWKALNEWMEKYDRQVVPFSRTYHCASALRVVR